MTTTTATYTKLRDGSWGIRYSSESTAKAGDRIAVTKRDGTTKTETLGRLVWAGNGVAIATIAQSGNSTAQRTGSGRSGRTGWTDGHGAYLVRGEYHCTRAGCWCGGYDEAS